MYSLQKLDFIGYEGQFVVGHIKVLQVFQSEETEMNKEDML